MPVIAPKIVLLAEPVLIARLPAFEMAALSVIAPLADITERPPAPMVAPPSTIVPAPLAVIDVAPVPVDRFDNMLILCPASPVTETPLVEVAAIVPSPANASVAPDPASSFTTKAEVPESVATPSNCTEVPPAGALPPSVTVPLVPVIALPDSNSTPGEPETADVP